jgi:hypothetical protein
VHLVPEILGQAAASVEDNSPEHEMAELITVQLRCHRAAARGRGLQRRVDVSRASSGGHFDTRLAI